MNRSGGDDRVPLIAETEKQLNTLLNDFFVGCDLEIEFQTPTLEVLLSAPKLYVDDGFRNAVENKGHGQQRAIIFTILRRYAEYITCSGEGKNRNLILAVAVMITRTSLINPRTFFPWLEKVKMSRRLSLSQIA